MMQFVFLIIIGLLSGICASLGIGGGFVLLIYLTVIQSTNQLEAQLINLVFFIPIAILSLIFHMKHNLVVKDIAFKMILSGIAGAIVGVFIATILDAKLLSKLFALFILTIGVQQLCKKEKILEKDETKEYQFRMFR